MQKGELRRENFRRTSKKSKSDVRFTSNWQLKVGLYVESVLYDIHWSILGEQMIFPDICKKLHRSSENSFHNEYHRTKCQQPLKDDSFYTRRSIVSFLLTGGLTAVDFSHICPESLMKIDVINRNNRNKVKNMKKTTHSSWHR